MQLFLQHRRPNGRRQLPRALGALAVAVHGARLARRLQHQSRAFEQPVNRRVVGLDKCRHHLGQIAQTAPLVARQQFDGAVVRGQHDVVRLRRWAAVQRKVQHRRLGLAQARQQRAIELHIQVVQVVGGARADGVQMPAARFDKRRLRVQRQRQPLNRHRRGVDNCQLLQRGHGVLKVCQIELDHRADVQADAQQHRRLSACRIGSAAIRTRLDTRIHQPQRQL